MTDSPSSGEVASPEEVLAALHHELTARAEALRSGATMCHRQIVAERLEVVPWAATCVACA